MRISTSYLLQSALVISKSKGLSEILRDSRSSTYQICRIEKQNESNNQISEMDMYKFVRKIEKKWKLCGKEEKLLLRNKFSSFPHHFITYCKISMLKTGTRFSFRYKRLFGISKVEITKVDYILFLFKS